MKPCRRLFLRYIPGVQASPSRGPEHLVDTLLETNSHIANMPAQMRFLADDVTQRQRVVQLRIGGAQMLSGTASRIYNNNEAHPLYFARSSPKESGLCSALVDSLARLKIRRLTELQGALIPLLLRGKHVIAHAETGTGKSFGIALATANRIVRQQLNHRLHTIILVPTEELALQYDKWLKHFAGCASQVCQPAVESIPLESQLAKLHNIQPGVIVGTCQRVADIFISAPTIIQESLRKRVDCIILDEADLLLNAPIKLGRRQATGADLIDRLYRQHTEEVPAQMVATSATIDGATAQRLNTWMRNDKAVRITTSFVEYSIPETLTFYFFASAVIPKVARSCQSLSSPAAPRYDLPECLELVLRLILRQSRGSPSQTPRILIFSNEATETVLALLASMESRVLAEWRNENGDTERPSSSKFKFCGALHDPPDPLNPNRHVKARELIGRNKEIFVRNDSNISLLNEGHLLIGVGSYEISRGMHVAGVTHVIMYGDVPAPTEFVHCAGRAGRMGKEGDVICLFPPCQGKGLENVCNALEIPLKILKMKTVDALLNTSASFMSGADADAAVDPLTVRGEQYASEAIFAASAQDNQRVGVESRLGSEESEATSAAPRGLSSGADVADIFY